MSLTGCSVIDNYQLPKQPTVRSLPKIPEIKRQPTARPRYVPPKKAVIRKPSAPKPVVKKYTIKSTVKKPQKPIITEQQRIEQQERARQKAKEKATVDIDPFADIPDNSSNTSSVTTRSKKSVTSPAVRTLLTSARADIALGRSRSAISKLERGLRIEPQNAQLWHMLAKAHYANSAFLHSISMAKKSNSNTNDDELISENWKLIKQAGERSGNANAIKEALDYMKVNP